MYTQMSDTEMSDAELAALLKDLKQYEQEVEAENVKPKPLTPEELQKQMDELEEEYNQNNPTTPTTPTTPIMSDEEYNALLDEYQGGKTKRHRKRTHKKKRTYRKKSMNKKKRTHKKKRANRATHRRRH